MRNRVGKFLKDHLSTRTPYRQCKGMLRFYEDRIDELKRRELTGPFIEEEVRKVAEELEGLRQAQDEVLGELDELVPVVFQEQEDTLQEWSEARRMRGKAA